MIDLFSGEFLVSPIPLNMTLNYCSHGCNFCFANNSVPNRTANVKGIMALLGGVSTRKTLVAKLLNQGYPVLVSNHVDLLAHSNATIGLPIVRTMVELGIPIQIQTRGGKQEWVDELLSFLPVPSVFYISISSLDEELRRKIEPGATTVDSRFTLIERLRTMGHTVVLGLNPLVREWQPDTSPLLDRAKAAGAQGVWIERLHLNYNQIGNMSGREKGNLTDSLIKKAQKRKPDTIDTDHFDAARAYALDIGLEVFSIGQGCRSDFFSLYHRTYPGHTFPTLQDFVNMCYDHHLEGQLIPFQIFADFFTPYLPQGVLTIDQYLGATAHNLWRDTKVPPQMTYRQLLSIIWSDYRIKNCPARLRCFAWAAQWDESDGNPGWLQLTDAEGFPYLVFDPNGYTDYYTHVDV